MESRKIASSAAAPQGTQLTSSCAAGATGDPHDFTLLLALAERMLGMWDGVGDRLCREVGSLTQQRALLRLHSAEQARTVRNGLPPDTHLHPVEFAGQIYGTLLVAPDPDDRAVPAVPDAQAQELAHICGAVRFLLEQAALLHVLSQHLTLETPEPLTPRQREVLTLLARGLRDDEIVEALHISPETLRRHRYDIAARLGVHAAHDLLLAGYQYGLVSYITPEA